MQSSGLARLTTEEPDGGVNDDAILICVAEQAGCTVANGNVSTNAEISTRQ